MRDQPSESKRVSLQIRDEAFFVFFADLFPTYVIFFYSNGVLLLTEVAILGSMSQGQNRGRLNSHYFPF